MLSVLVLLAALSTSDTANRLFEAAEQEEHDQAYAQALEDYEASFAEDPSGRYALRATARARWLRARSEGGFAPLTRLEAVRRDPGAQHDAAVIDALARDLESFPKGEVRAEARMLVAEAYGFQLARPREAERELDRLLDEPIADEPVRAQAAVRLADIAMAAGDASTARSAARRVVDPTLSVRVARWARRRILVRAASGLLALFATLSCVACARRPRALHGLRRFAPRAFAMCAYLGLVAGALANAYEHGHALPFLMFPATLFVLVLLTRAWALTGGRTPAARAGRALLGASAVVASAFLVLDLVDVRYLESFGL